MHAIETTTTTLATRVAELEVALAAAHERIAALIKERDQLRASHARLREELELLKRRIFVAKAERVDTAQLEMEFAEKLRELDKLAQTLAESEAATADAGASVATESSGAPPPSDDDQEESKKKPTGRRNLKNLPLEE
ncbi:MAG: hypothetical protein ACREJX_14490, partial [Polyangiaceae bacterium]